MRQTTLPFRTSWNTLPPLSSDTITTQRAVFVWTGRIGWQARLRGRSPVLKHLRTLVCEQVAGGEWFGNFHLAGLEYADDTTLLNSGRKENPCTSATDTCLPPTFVYRLRYYRIHQLLYPLGSVANNGDLKPEIKRRRGLATTNWCCVPQAKAADLPSLHLLRPQAGGNLENAADLAQNHVRWRYLMKLISSMHSVDPYYHY